MNPETQKQTGESTDAEKLEVIEAHWRKLAAGHAAAGLVLRTCLDDRKRNKAIEIRCNTYGASDSMLDAYHDITTGEFTNG